MKLRSLLFYVFAVGVSMLVSPAESSAQTWTFCAREGGACTFSGTQQVRYGANGLYAYKTLTGSTACTNSVFGDPAPGVAKQCDTATSTSTGSWTACANEGGTCSFSGTQEVRYGANGLYAYKTLTGGTACTNAVFGDPAPGVLKQCATGDSSGTTPTGSWSVCANEGGTCSFSGTQEVRYGANGLYAYKTLTGGTACTNAVFGDPAPGVLKQCATGSTTTSTDGWSVCANEGGTCAFSGTQQVRYGANSLYAYKTLTGGTACTNSVFGDPAPGMVKQCAIGGTSSSPQPAPIAPSVTSGYGPQPTITCPSGAIDVWPGQPIQTAVNNYPGSTTFCLRAGVHSLTSSITPKTGNTFVGEYGAVLDGSNWSSSDSTQAAFRAHNQDIDYVTIRNLVIRKMPQKGIHAFYWLTPDHWTIENNEIAENKTGILFPDHSVIRNNYIHHNYDDPSATDPGRRGGGYVGYYASYTTFENNEIAYNGKEQKIMESVSVTFRNNFAHHNQADGIWYDGGNPSALIEGNRVEDNARNGIFYEASNGSTIRNNTVRRSGDTGIFISTSQNADIYGNTVEDNFRAITYFVNCGGMVGRDIDLQNNSAHDNSIRVGTQSGAFGTGMSYTGDCSATQVNTYHNGSKNLRFSHNTYDVPDPGGWYWLWNGMKQWFQWQGVPQDTDGSVQ
jgi:parallel beta-helix repeat protein